MKIKAIETRYKGYRFRSRLEARWAVFFDEARIEWEYEAEGFNLDGTKYLPDFFLPNLGTYVEVKGSGDISDNEWDKVWRFSKYKPIIVFRGQMPGSFSDFDDGGGVFVPITLSPSPDGDDTRFPMYRDCCGYQYIGSPIHHTMKQESCPRCDAGSSRETISEEALLIARSARFEHGEQPRSAGARHGLPRH